MFISSRDVLDTADASTALLILAWSEMFDPFTPDTFQPRLFNVPLLVRELREIAPRVTSSPERWQQHFKWVREELASAVATDSAFLERIPYYTAMCRRLTLVSNAVEVERLCNSLAALEEPYEQAAKEALVEAAARLPKDKEIAIQALHRIATISLRCGFGNEEFREVLESPAYQIPASEWVTRFLAAFEDAKKPEREFDCVIPVFGVDERAYHKMLKFKPEFHLRTPSELPPKLARVFKGAAFFEINCVRANTATEAARKTVSRLRPSLDILSFYEHELVPKFGDTAWVGHQNKGKFVKIAGQFLRSLPSRRSAAQLTKEALQIPNHLLTGRVLNALEHLNLAKANSAFRAKLMNLWSALECLSVAGDSGESVFGRVRETVVPIVTWRRTDKITRYLASKLTKLKESGLAGDFGPLFSPGDFVSAEEVLLALAKPLEHPDLGPLYSALDRHPLVKNRIFTLRKTFAEPKALLGDLRVSTERTVWHLARIYRARNLIVHEGQEDAVVPHLVDNLQYYLSITLSRILHGMASRIGWDVTDSIVHWRGKSWYMMQMLDESPTSLQVRDFFPVPRRCVHQQVWPPKATSIPTSPPAVVPAPPSSSSSSSPPPRPPPSSADGTGTIGSK